MATSANATPQADPSQQVTATTLNNKILGDGSSGGSQVTGAAAADASTADSSGGGIDLSGILSSLIPSSSTISGLAPYLAAAGVGVEQASSAAKQNNQLTGQLATLGQPLTAAGTQLLNQAQSGTLTPAQQAVVDQDQRDGQQLIDSAAPLASIANSAFADYQAGNLQPGQQQQIDAWTASAKQSLRQTLGDQGISDSSILASQDASIDSQAQQLKANLMQQNLQVGDQQFSAWLTTTQAGQATQQAGKQFAVTSVNTMLQQALGFSQAGMEPQEQAVQQAIASNNQLSASVSGLFQSLMMAYATAQYGKQGKAGTTGSGGSGAGSAVGNAVGSGASSLYGAGSAAATRLAGGNNGNSISSYYGSGDGQLNFTSDFNDGSSGYNLNTDGTVDPNTFNSFFYDPSSDNLPDIDFGP